MNPLNVIHVILADYDTDRRDLVAEGMLSPDILVHKCSDRIEALGKYWMLYAEGILPRAVVANWLMDTHESRSFFSAVGREVDHTSLALFVNVAKLDPHGILVCYTDDMAETVTELEHSEVADKVQVVRMEDATQEVVKLLRLDERSRTSKTSGNASGIRVARRSLLSR